jgi:dihydrofolate reductase
VLLDEQVPQALTAEFLCAIPGLRRLPAGCSGDDFFDPRRSTGASTSFPKQPQLKKIIVGKIAVHEFITLDGVIEAPTWTFDYPFDPTIGESIGALMGSSKAILLGRNTYEQFAPAWSGRSAEDDPGAPFMNDSPKYVVSATLQKADWNNSTILGAYSADAIRSLKDSIDGNIYVSGSGTLVRAMLADGLIDELHLFVFPLTLGAGERLFANGGAATKLALTGTDVYQGGVVHLAYRPSP